jgi:hypothetical protein
MAAIVRNIILQDYLARDVCLHAHLSNSSELGTIQQKTSWFCEHCIGLSEGACPGCFSSETLGFEMGPLPFPPTAIRKGGKVCECHWRAMRQAWALDSDAVLCASGARVREERRALRAFAPHRGMPRAIAPSLQSARGNHPSCSTPRPKSSPRHSTALSRRSATRASASSPSTTPSVPRKHGKYPFEAPRPRPG